MVKIVYLPKIALIIVLPILRSIPDFVVGIPVFRATLLFNPLIPSSLFSENENPYFPLNPNIFLVFILFSKFILSSVFNSFY